MKDWRFPGLLALVVVLIATVTVLSLRVKQEQWELDLVRSQNQVLTKQVVHLTKAMEQMSLVIKNHEKRIQQWEVKASWYGPGLHGRKAADGSTYDQNAYTCAHRTLPFGTVLVLENPSNRRRVTCVVTDRGPYIEGRGLDVSRRVADELGFTRSGVKVLVVNQVTL